MRAKPIGYPHTSSICGIRGCTKPGFVWLTDEELQAFNEGERLYRVKTYTVKVRVSDELIPLP
jgi:hypothetical protein